MKKTILATAIAAAVMAAPMTAVANVVIYGKIHASIDYVDPKDRFLVKLPDEDDIADRDVFSSNGNWSINNRTTRIGFKGSEDLGNGLKAIWKAEIGYNLDGDGSTSFEGFDKETGLPTFRTSGSGWGAGRNSYIGLAGDWGTVLMGKHDTPLKISTGRLDVFADTMADYNSTIGFLDFRPNNVIAYISPNWNGFTFAAAGVASEDYGNDDVGDGAYSLAAMYFNNGFYGSVAYEDISGITALDTFNTFRVGAGYILNAFTFGVVYEHTEQGYDNGNHTFDPSSFGGDKVKTDKWQVLGAYDFGNNTVKAMVGQYDPDTNSDRGLSQYRSNSQTAWAIGWDHKLSVRTKVYALYADSELSLHDAPETLFTGGAQGFSMGMVHTF
jgi:predicted porin